MNFLSKIIHNKPKIFIPFESFNTIGGPTTFMTNLKSYLDNINYSYQSEPNNAKVIFFPVSFDLELIKKIKSNGGKVIQRLDGAYYPSQHGENYKEMNEDFENIYKHYSDFIVFQSNYSKLQCNILLGETDKESTIIINGVNKEIFFPQNKREKSSKIKFISTGNFRKKAMIEPIVLALDSLLGQFEFELELVGPINSNEFKSYLNRDYIKHTEGSDLSKVSERLRDSDIFIHSQLNDNCPNAVLEAVSCGLPIVGFDSGAMSELVFFSKDLLAYVSKDPIQVYEDFDYKKLAEKIKISVDEFEEFKKISLEHSNLYDFKECGQKYVEVFENCLEFN